METMMGRKVQRHSPPAFPRQDDDLALMPETTQSRADLDEVDRYLTNIDEGGQKTGTYAESRRLQKPAMPKRTGTKLPRWLRWGKD